MFRRRQSRAARIQETLIVLGVGLVVALIASGCGGPKTPRFTEPIAVDWDMADIPEPKEERASQYYDIFDRSFSKSIHRALDMPRNARMIAGNPKQAYNYDGFGQVPNSSWFTNRNGRKQMTADEIKRGPNTGDGPAEGTWMVVRGKTQGVTPGFTIKDARGDRYIIKFDPPTNPEMSTAAEMISTKLFHAMGYNTPENRLVYFKVDRLQVDPEAKFVDKLGNKRTMTEYDLDEILTDVYKAQDGTFRAVASEFLPGIPKGPYAYIGTRKDDPNDIYPHEHRRDLRGLKLMAAWLEHNDVRRINSLDIYTEVDGRRFLRHYLIDFGATLGSASLFPNLPSEGHEYIWDWAETGKSLFTLGIYDRPWRSQKPPVYPTVGLFESELFNPADWKPNYPNPAFGNMTNLDAFWATKIVMSFTDEQIRAAVEMGELGNPDAEAYLVKTLIERRDKIGRYWYRQVNPLDRFTIEGVGASAMLTFEDLELSAQFEERSRTRYRYVLSHNGCEGPRTIGEDRYLSGSDAVFGIPFGELAGTIEADLQAKAVPGDCDRFFFITLWTRRGNDSTEWGKFVRVHFRFTSAERGLEIVTVEHEE